MSVIFNEIEAGDLILTRGDGPYSKTIQWFTDSEYNHVAIALSSYTLIEAKLTVETNPISTYDDFDVYRKIGGLTPKEKEKMIEFLLKKHGTKYDVFQIAGYIHQALFGGENKFNNPNYVICSELGDDAYLNLGYDVRPDIKKGDCRPCDIIEPSEGCCDIFFEKVYSFKRPS